MKSKKLRELEERYNLELEKAVDEIKKIKKQKPRVLLQLPDGLKPYATSIAEYLQENVKDSEISIWLGSCFGACDIPESDCDLLIQFGHAPWE